jgi:hypothetical protein
MLMLYVKMLIALLYFIDDAAAYRVYVYMLYPLQESTYFPARDTTYTHTHDMLPHHR